MSHSQIASHPEPWFLLPCVYMSRQVGIHTEYGHQTSVNALENLLKHLPTGEEDYYEAARNFAQSIYTKLSRGKPFFIDKTPRYYFIIPEIKKIFPDAKFIFLIRNPLSIFASSIEAFRNNSLRRLDHLDRDFFVGPKLIAEGVKLLGEDGLVVRYEDLIALPEDVTKMILAYLGLSFEPDMIARSFDQKLGGLGDNLGAKKYKSIQDQRQKWKTIINTSYRKFRIKHFSEQFDSGYLDLGGYSKKELAQAIAEHEDVWKHIFEWLWWVEEVVIRSLKRIAKHKSYS